MSTKSVPTPTSLCRFGISRADITPPVGIYHRLWGAALHDQANGVHRPLTATALAFASADPRAAPSAAGPLVIVAVDHCLLLANVMDEVLQTASRESKVPEANLVFAFSHTHSGGNLDPDRSEMPGGDKIRPYLDQLSRTCAEVVREAVASLQPATLTYAATQCALGQNRDYWDAEREDYLCGFNPDQTCDQGLLIARVTGERGQTLGTIVNYACHPTTLAWENDLISPDYIGAMREVVEQASGAPCAFLLSPCGDIGPQFGFVGDARVADKNGRQLGYAALGALESMAPPAQDFDYVGPVFSGATLGIWKYGDQSPRRQAEVSRFRAARLQIDVPYLDGLGTLEEVERDLERLVVEEQKALSAGNEDDARTARAKVERKRRIRARLRLLPPGKAYPYTAWVWQFGDSIWVALEGEPYNWVQSELRARFAGHPVMITTVANGSRCCYLPTREAYARPLYQVDIALLAPGSLEIVAERVAQHIETMLRSR